MFRWRKRKQSDFAAEIQAHLEIEADRLRREGLSEAEARAAAYRAFGNVTAAGERFYERSRWMWADRLNQDLHYAFRTLLRSPGFTVVALGTIALGIAANTTIFSAINALLLRPLPHKDPERLVMIWDAFTDRKQGGSTYQAPVTVGNFHDWVKQNSVFDQMGLTSGVDPLTITGSGEAERIQAQSVSPELLEVIGARAALGRIFVPDDRQRNLGKVVLLSDGFWRRRFHADPQILGKQITIGAQPLTVVGVMPPNFWILPRAWVRLQDNGGPDVWNMLDSTSPYIADNRHSRVLYAFGKLKPVITMEQAQAEMNTIADRLAHEYPQTNKGWGVQVQPLQSALFGQYTSALYFLMGAVVLVLLIPCANIANLLLARAAARQRETAIRASLGACRPRLIRQWLTESLVLSVAGGCLGVVFAIWGIKLFTLLAPARLARAVEITIDGRVLLFSLAASLFTGLLFGLAPALQASRTDVTEALKEAARGRQWSFRRGRLRALLMVTEVALSIILLVGAGLAIRSFVRVLQVDPGFQPDGLLTAMVFPFGPKYMQMAGGQSDTKRVTPQVAQFYSEAVSRLEALPQVESAAFASSVPNRYLEGRHLQIVGRVATSPAERPGSGYVEVHPNFFQTMRIPLLKGRYLSDRDTESSPWVVVINEAMARIHWPGADSAGSALGSLIRLDIERGMSEDRVREVVGVIGNMRHEPVSGPSPIMYVSYLQRPTEYPGGRANSHLRKTLLIRSSADPSALGGALRRVISELDADQPVYDVMTANELLSSSPLFVYWQFQTRVLGLFAAIALMLAAAGIYGVMSYLVAQRYHEIGIRMALGARRATVVRMVLGDALKLTSVGIAVGLSGAWALTRVAALRFYGLGNTDPLTLSVVSVLLAVVAMCAAYVPAHRALRRSPMAALRCD